MGTLNVEKITDQSLYMRILNYIKSKEDGTIFTIGGIANDFLRDNKLGIADRPIVIREVRRVCEAISQYCKVYTLSNGQYVVNFKIKPADESNIPRDLEKYEDR